MRRIFKVFLVSSVICGLCLSGLTVFGLDSGVNNGMYQPGSGGMYQMDEDGEVTFISGEEILNYDHIAEEASGTIELDSSEMKDIAGGTIKPILPVGTYSPMVLVSAYFKGTGVTQFSSGFMVGPTGIATSAHSLYNRKNDEWADSVLVYFKFDNGTYDKVMMKKSMFIGGDYKTSDLDDWGMITLASPPNVNYFGFKANDNVNNVIGKSIKFAGFTGFFHEDSHYFDQQELCMSSGKITTSWTLKELQGIVFDCDAFKGMSGGPALDATDFKVLGIGTRENIAPKRNGGLLINSWLYNTFMQYSGR